MQDSWAEYPERSRQSETPSQPRSSPCGWPRTPFISARSRRPRTCSPVMQTFYPLRHQSHHRQAPGPVQELGVLSISILARRGRISETLAAGRSIWAGLRQVPSWLDLSQPSRARSGGGPSRGCRKSSCRTSAGGGSWSCRGRATRNPQRRTCASERGRRR